MNITCIIFGIAFLIFGLLFSFGKLHIFIKAWKDMPQEEKDKINILPLCRNIGFLIVLSGVIFIAGGVVEPFREQWFVLSMIIWLILAGVDVFYIYKSKHYKNNN